MGEMVATLSRFVLCFDGALLYSIFVCISLFFNDASCRSVEEANLRFWLLNLSIILSSLVRLVLIDKGALSPTLLLTPLKLVLRRGTLPLPMLTPDAVELEPSLSNRTCFSRRCCSKEEERFLPLIDFGVLVEFGLEDSNGVVLAEFIMLEFELRFGLELRLGLDETTPVCWEKKNVRSIINSTNCRMRRHVWITYFIIVTQDFFIKVI